LFSLRSLDTLRSQEIGSYLQTIVILSFLKGGFHQKRLLEKLFRKYNPIERPVERDTESLNVTIGLALQQIVDVVSIFLNK
jgi:hypothetical protein